MTLLKKIKCEERSKDMPWKTWFLFSLYWEWFLKVSDLQASLNYISTIVIISLEV